jgi:Arylsulfotransferase (ASST)
MRPLQLLQAALALTILPFATAQGVAPTGTNITGPLSQFKSRPDIYAPFMNITLHEDDRVVPGYIFIGAYQTFQEGPYIYDSRGNLVYSGFAATGRGPSHVFHVCTINGTDNLCYVTGAQNSGYIRGYGVVMDDTFTVVTSVKSGGGVANFDEHEFNVVDDGRNVLMTLYDPQQYDLTDWDISTGQGWIMNCYFQKLELGTNRLLFEWSALDHVSITETTVAPNSTEVSGDGLNPTLPWDWFHINSVDQNADGDYLVSGRHVSTIYKISGQDGHVIWRLGGSMSDFHFPPGLNFSFQHDARWREENATTTILSLFDNGSNGYNQTSRYSKGMILKLDHTDNTVTLLRSYIAPLKLLSASQGNLQVLGPNSAWNTANTFLGWGNNAYISEYANDGTMVLQGHFATTGSMNYRAFKYNYTTNPTDAPALYTYAHNQSAATVYYMSWNGATKVHSWRMYGAADKTGPWTTIDTVDKNGFETTFVAPRFHAWALVEALDANGDSLRNNTKPIKTFVPGQILASNCNEFQCPVVNRYVAANGSGTTGDRSSPTSSSAASVRRSKRDGDWGYGYAAAMGVGAMLLP